MRAIKKPCGAIFAACNSNYIDAEWKLQEAYYIAQGCTVEEMEEVRFSECDHVGCELIQHEFEELIEEIIKERS